MNARSKAEQLINEGKLTLPVSYRPCILVLTGFLAGFLTSAVIDWASNTLYQFRIEEEVERIKSSAGVGDVGGIPQSIYLASIEADFRSDMTGMHLTWSWELKSNNETHAVCICIVNKNRERRELTLVSHYATGKPLQTLERAVRLRGQFVEEFTVSLNGEYADDVGFISAWSYENSGELSIVGVCHLSR